MAPSVGLFWGAGCCLALLLRLVNGYVVSSNAGAISVRVPLNVYDSTSMTFSIGLGYL